MTPPDSPEVPQSQPVPSPSQTVPGLGRRELVAALAAGLAICFFVPWVNLLITRPSGFDLQRNGVGKLFWLLPVLAAVTVSAGLIGRSQKILGLLTGLTPFAFLAYGLSEMGSRLFDVMTPGAWVGLGLGAVLVIVSIR